ncbi:outer membrane beta-barrel protein, partial [Bacteroidota bacterium]
MRRFVLIGLIIIFTTISLKAQSLYEVKRLQDSLGLFSRKYGLFFDYGINQHPATFMKITGVPLGNYDPLSTVSGSGISVGLFYEYPFSKKLSLMTRLGYYQLNGSFSNIEVEPSSLNGEPVDVDIEFKIDATLAAIGLEPLISYEVYDGLNIVAGPNISFLMTKQFNQIEQIVNPDAPSFDDGSPNGSRERNVEAGDLSTVSSIYLGLTGGISYELPLSSRILPTIDILYTQGLTDIEPDMAWGISSIRFGTTIKYVADRPCPRGMGRNAEGNCEEMPCPPGQIRNDDGECECREGMFVNNNGDCEWPPCPERNFARTELGECYQVLFAEVDAEPILSSGLPASTDDLTVKEAKSVTHLALLNYVFFDEGKPEIPDNYFLFENDDKIGSFKEADVADRENPLNTYYNLLNIIGYRMSINPLAKITLVSYNMGGSESGDPDLPRKRIDSITDYLQNIWKIPSFRIPEENKIVYNIPPNVARSGDESMIAEYRRVEIIPDTANIAILK